MLENPIENKTKEITNLGLGISRNDILDDFKICCISREASLLARKEVLTGKAKFGIVGDGKELPQVIMARAFKKGDFRSGYYRDQTFMLALGLTTIEDFFAQLYADADNDPFSGGRQMNSHYATPLLDKDGEWNQHTNQYNISSDISCTGGQMARGIGLSLASKIYRESKVLQENKQFSIKGNEVTFVTIGDASTSEGVFWESINAAAVMKIPMAISVWDDGYGISVPTKHQTTKESISEVLEGFRLDKNGNGIDIYTVKGWDYPILVETYEKAIKKTRKSHIPCLIHVQELTQPQGHSTSGSHERYKPKERLEWERAHDCLILFQKWILDNGIASSSELEAIMEDAKRFVKAGKDNAWKTFSDQTNAEIQVVKGLYAKLTESSNNKDAVLLALNEVNQMRTPFLNEVVQNVRRLLYELIGDQSDAKVELENWLEKIKSLTDQRYHSQLYSDSKNAALNYEVIPAKYSEDSKSINGSQVLNKCFDEALERMPTLFAFGEDVGQIGDVNQGFAGLQQKYGVERVFDAGIREWTIMGQAIGMSMRGLRPIAEIQYLDYLIYGLEPLTDDLATLRYRSNGIQQAPAIIRTRGHRLEGIWHAGSPIGMLINALQGMYICVPRNMTQAAGFYNGLLKSDDPALVIECLNGYRLKEKLPDNIGEFTVPLGVPEILATGTDVTILTYGSCIRVAQKGIELLNKKGISVELIDAQTLIPFDLEHMIVESLKKTSKIIFMDEDIPGGATAFMMREVLEKQNGYQYLDAAPKTLTAHAHRTPFGSDGDYFTKPHPEDVFDAVYEMMHEEDPSKYPAHKGFNTN